MKKITDKDRKIAFAIIFGAAFIVLTSIFLFSPNRAEILVPGNVALSVDGSKLSVGFYNYFYSSATTPEILLEMEKEYEGFDQTVPLDEQVYDAETGKTWAEYIDETVEEQISYLVKAYNDGVSAGVSVFDEQQKNVDAIIKSLEEEADRLSIGVSDYTSYTYGDHVGVKTVKKILEMSYIAQNYYEYYVTQSTISADEYADYYEKNKSKFVSVEYFCCEITGEDDSDELKEISELLLPEISADNFEEVLNEKLSGFDTSISKRRDLLLNFEGDEDIKNWIFDTHRKAGDKTVIADKEKECIYIVLAVTEPTEETAVTCSAREIAMRVTDFGGWDKLDEVVSEVEDKIKEIENKEYTFAVYADIYMNNLQGDSSGGLVTNLRNADGKAEKWIYDPERERGDYIRLKTDNGYYLIMFIEKKPSWQFFADEEIINIKFKNSMKNVVFQRKYAFRYTKG